MPGNYTHLTVNHGQNIVKPVNGAHTNNVEGYWKKVKAIFKRMGRPRIWSQATWTSSCGGNISAEPFIWPPVTYRPYCGTIPLLDKVIHCDNEPNSPFQGHQI